MSTGGGTLDILLELPEPIVRYPATPAVPVRYPATAGLSDMNRSCLWSLYEAHTEEDSRILLTWENREKWGLHTGYVLFFFVRPLVCIRLGLSLVLICCRATCDTVPIWETKLRATEARAVFTAGMPAKLTRVQLCRHAGGKTSDVSCCWQRYVLIRRRTRLYSETSLIRTLTGAIESVRIKRVEFRENEMSLSSGCP